MASSRKLRRAHYVMGALSAFLFGASSIHCGSTGTGAGSTGSGFGGSGGSSTTTSGSAGGSTTMSGGTGGDITFDVYVPDYSAEQFFDDDPPPLMCDGGGMAPPPPGGTPECPDDKNLEGCPCPAGGMTAACWPGKRKNRNHGVCKDGITTCKLTGENNLSWGPCVGAQLPTAETGKGACGCFSGGHWALANLSPCFFFDADGVTVTDTISTTLSGGQIQCPSDPSVAPAEDWTTDTLKTDCTGNFKLCYSLKAGDGKNPMPGDCEIIKVCTQGYYSPANSTIPFPPIKGWLADPSTQSCAQKFVDQGGYGEMSVDGQSDECETVNKVFQHVTYCPLACNQPNPPAMCANCMPGGGGNF